MPETNDLGNVGTVSVSAPSLWTKLGNVGAFSQIFSPLFNLANSGINYLFQKKAMDYQNELQLKWWNMQNEYNHPKQQIKRMVEAGLNPNLAYGNISSSNAGDVGTPRVAQAQYNMSPTFISDAISQAIGLASQAQQLQRQRIENELLQSRQFGYPTDYDYDGKHFQFNSLSDWLAFKERLGSYRLSADTINRTLDLLFKRDTYDTRKDLLSNKSLALAYANQYNMRSLEDRLALTAFRRSLTERQAEGQQLRNMFQTKVNDWYVANQVFNMVNQGINTIFGFIRPFIPKNAVKDFDKGMKPVLKEVVGNNGEKSYRRTYTYY